MAKDRSKRDEVAARLHPAACKCLTQRMEGQATSQCAGGQFTESNSGAPQEGTGRVPQYEVRAGIPLATRSKNTDQVCCNRHAPFVGALIGPNRNQLLLQIDVGPLEFLSLAASDPSFVEQIHDIQEVG